MIAIHNTIEEGQKGTGKKNDGVFSRHIKRVVSSD